MAEDKDDHNAKLRIDESLRRVYQQKLEEDLPDRFHDLLAQLKAKEKSKDGPE